MNLNDNYNSRKRLKKRKFNDSINKYKKENPSLIKKKELEINTNIIGEDLPYPKPPTKLGDIYKKLIKKENILNSNLMNRFGKNNSFKRISLSAPKRGFLKKPSGKTINISRRNIYLNSQNDSSFFDRKNDPTDISDSDYKNKYSMIVPSSSNYYRDHSNRISYKPILTTTNYNINTERRSESISEKNNLIVILNKQNKELRIKNREMRFQMNELLNKQKLIKNDNQNLSNENQKLLMDIERLENDFEYYKNMTLNELENKTNKISKLSEDLVKMKNIIDTKGYENINLENNDSYPQNFYNYKNNAYQNENQEFDYNEENDENDVNNNNIIELNDFNNNLINHINNLELKNQNILNQKKENEKILNQKMNNLIIANKKNNNIIANLKNENEKLKNSIQNQSQNNKNLNELKEKIAFLENENNQLKSVKNIMDNNAYKLIEERNQLLEENQNLKNSLNKIDLRSTPSSNNYAIENINLKAQLEKKEEQLKFQQIRINGLSKGNKNSKEEINNLKKKISELENLNNNLNSINNKLKINISSSVNKSNSSTSNQFLQNEIIELKKENEEKKYEIAQLKNQIENYNIKIPVEDNEQNQGIDTFNIKINNDIITKNNIIEKLEKENNSIKNFYQKLSKENLQLKEKIQLLQNGQDEGLINTLDKFKEEIKDKEEQIQILIKENINIRKKIKNSNDDNNINNEDEEEKEIDLNNIGYENNPFRPTMNSQGLTDADKIKLYKERLKEYEINNISDKLQIKTLKEDIKKYLAKIKYLETFGGLIKDINEFISLLNQVLINCKLKGEQKEALDKIIEALNNYNP